ncbi:hypothetical protein IKZ77_03065 [Candidatus Saccharibacteria bacterium]|nr:hypothetical protein [Candidatus Saccharibacteria bacterium]
MGEQISGWIAALGLLGGGTFLFALIQSGGGIGGSVVWIGLLVLGIVITIVMAMLTLYLVLIIREAGIILLVVLSPVAVVCNLLPNTDKIYKKWFGMFKALLIVYPICGAMVGAGKLAGSILATIDSESMRLAAMIVQVLPFFLIPSMLKSSLALMGNIGAKVSSLGKAYGKKASGGATGMIRNSERFKDLAQRQKDEKSVRMANRVRNRYKDRVNLNDRQRLRLYAANQTINQYRMTSSAARAGAFELTADAALRRAEASRDAQEQKAFSEDLIIWIQVH